MHCNKLLKRNPLPWEREHINAIEVSKEKLLYLPPLQVPSDGKRILGSDDSEKYWIVVLLEEIDERDISVNIRGDGFHPPNFTTTLY